MTLVLSTNIMQLEKTLGILRMLRKRFSLIIFFTKVRQKDDL